jgi:hypothetical protein
MGSHPGAVAATILLLGILFPTINPDRALWYIAMMRRPV